MGVILDTTLLIAFERNAVDLDAFIHGRAQQAFGISVVTASELLHGVYRADTAKRRIKRAAYVEKVLDQITVYPFDLAAARVYADVWAHLQKQGVWDRCGPVGSNPRRSRCANHRASCRSSACFSPLS